MTVSTLEGLTARQSEVIALVAEGRTTREMASSLAVTDRAVTAVLSRLFPSHIGTELPD